MLTAKSDFLKEQDEDFKDDPDYQLLSEEEKCRIVYMLEKMMAIAHTLNEILCNVKSGKTGH